LRCRKVLRQPDQTPRFWQRHRHDKLVARWVAAAGAPNVTVIVVDGSDRLALLRTFESLLGLPAGFLVPEDGVVNRSLTLAEAEVVRRLNEEFKRREWPGTSYAALGVRVIGDISALGASPARQREAEGGAGPAIPPVPVEAAVQAVPGAILAGGMADQAAEADKWAVADRFVREVDARRLAGVLVRRGRQRMRRALRPG
jgi:hypothetical protein